MQARVRRSWASSRSAPRRVARFEPRARCIRPGSRARAARCAPAPAPRPRQVEAAYRNATRSTSPQSTTPGDGWNDADLFAVLELGLQTVQKANVLIADVEIDEASHAFVIHEPFLHARVGGFETVDQVAHRLALDLNGFFTGSKGAQWGGDTNCNCHGNHSFLIAMVKCMPRFRSWANRSGSVELAR